MDEYGLAEEAERIVDGLKERREMFADGRLMYAALLKHKKYQGQNIVFPTEQQYQDLAKMLDLPVSYVRKRVEIYLFD